MAQENRLTNGGSGSGSSSDTDTTDDPYGAQARARRAGVDPPDDDPDDGGGAETSSGGGSRDTTLDRGTSDSGDGGDSEPSDDADRESSEGGGSRDTTLDRGTSGSGDDSDPEPEPEPEPDPEPEPSLPDRDRQTPSAPDPPPADQIDDVDVRVGNQPADETTITVDEGAVRSDLRESIAEQEGVDPSDVEIDREGGVFEIRGEGFRGEIGVDAVAESLEEGTAAQSDPFGAGDVVAEPTDDGFRIGVTTEAVDDYREQRRAEFEAGLGLDAAGGQVDTRSFGVPEEGMPDVGAPDAPPGMDVDPDTVPTGRGSRSVGLDRGAVDRDVSGPEPDTGDGGPFGDTGGGGLLGAPLAAAGAVGEFAEGRDMSVAGFRGWQREQQQRIDDATLDDPIEEATADYPDEEDVVSASRGVASDALGLGLTLGGEFAAEVDPRQEGPVEGTFGEFSRPTPPLVSGVGPRGLLSGARSGVQSARRLTQTGASAPSGAARSGPSAGAAVGQTAEFAPAAVDQFVRAGAVFGTAAAASTLTASEIPAPEEPATEQPEIDQPAEPTFGVGELDAPAEPIGRDDRAEIAAPTDPFSAVDTGEVGVPDPTTERDPFAIEARQTGLLREEEDEQTGEFGEFGDQRVRIGGEDIVTDLPEPEQDPPATRERIRRDDLFSPERDFPGREQQVVERDVPAEEPELDPDPVTVTEPATTPTGAEETLLGVGGDQGAVPVVGSLFGGDQDTTPGQLQRERATPDVRQDPITDPFAGTLPSAATRQRQGEVTIQDQLTRPGITVPGLQTAQRSAFETPTEQQPTQQQIQFGFGTPGPRPTTQRRMPFDLDLPQARGDEEFDEEPLFPATAPFANPIAGVSPFGPFGGE